MSDLRDGKKWVPVSQAATLMGCHRETARIRLKEHLTRRLFDGRLQDCVMLSRVRAVAIPVADDQLTQLAEIKEIRSQIDALQRAQIRLARGLGKVALRIGVAL